MLRELIIIAIVVQGTITAEETERCFASLICTASGVNTPSWTQIHPFPVCKGKSNSMELMKEYYKDSLLNLTEELSKLESNNIKPSYSASTQGEKGSEQCFVPVVCNAGSTTHTNWMQVFTSCKGGISDHASSELYENSTKHAMTEITQQIEQMCGNCTTNTLMVKAKEEIQKNTFSSDIFSAKDELKECYAPVICSVEDQTEDRWIKLYPPENCTAPQIATIESWNAMEAFGKSLTKAMEVFRDVKNECGKC